MALKPEKDYDGLPPWKKLTEADLKLIDQLLSSSPGLDAKQLVEDCLKRGFDVEEVDLVKNPWGEVQADSQWWRVRVWHRNGIVERSRRG